MQIFDKKIRVERRKFALGIMVAVLVAACAPPAAPPPANETAAAPPTVPNTACGRNGSLTAALTGGIEANIEWSAAELLCESMRRPNSDGIRLRFSGHVSDWHIAIIIAMPALRPGQSEGEIPSNLTVTVEGSGRFFSTPDLESCWTELAMQDLIANELNRYTIAGTVYCVAPLGELNGGSAVSIPELSFSGIVDWGTK